MSTWVVLTWASSPGSPHCVPGVCMGRAVRAKGNEWEEGAWSFYLTLMWKSGTLSPNISFFLHLPSALPPDFVTPVTPVFLPAQNSPSLAITRAITVSPVDSQLGVWSGVGEAGTGPEPCRQTHPPGCGTLSLSSSDKSRQQWYQLKNCPGNMRRLLCGNPISIEIFRSTIVHCLGRCTQVDRTR